MPATDSAPPPSLNIKSGIVMGLIARADELGIDCADWFRGTVLDRSRFQTEAPVYLSYRQACDIVRRALDGLPGLGHGLVIGERQDIGQFGLLGLAMLTARDFGEALRLGIQFAPITGAMVELHLGPARLSSEREGIAVTARMRTPEPAIEPFLCEELFASCLKLCHGLLGPGFSPARIELAYPPPPYADDYARVLGCETHFDMPANRVLIEAHWLATPMGAHNPTSARHVLALCQEQLLAGQPDSAVVAAVEELLHLQLADSPRLVDVAAELHLTERTLRRHLRGAGTSFRKLHDRIRRETAETLLRKPGIRIAEVGTALGFQDARDFRRAFKRWTGKVPREIRDRA